MINKYTPSPRKDILNLFNLLKSSKRFVFVRFSDGETEILKNRYNKISNIEVVYRGRSWKSIFPGYDLKEFNPFIHISLRRDLLAAAFYTNNQYFKGIPTSHNKVRLDKDFYLRLNGGLDKQITFADLLMNNNHQLFLNLIEEYLITKPNINLVIIANYRSKPIGFLSDSKIITVEDNFFNSYDSTKKRVITQIELLPENSLVLSSASSLSNIIGHYIIENNLPITLIDVGTSLHKYLSLDNSSRKYATGLFKKKLKW